jgi:hypothetical protein
MANSKAKMPEKEMGMDLNGAAGKYGTILGLSGRRGVTQDQVDEQKRVCFDVTLKGYLAIDETHNAIPQTEVNRLLGDLVKWIVAPDKTALDKFIDANNLRQCLDAEPYPMSEHACRNYGLDEGVDFILDAQGKVVEGDLEILKTWRADVSQAAKLLREYP